MRRLGGCLGHPFRCMRGVSNLTPPTLGGEGRGAVARRPRARWARRDLLAQAVDMDMGVHGLCIIPAALVNHWQHLAGSVDVSPEAVPHMASRRRELRGRRAVDEAAWAAAVLARVGLASPSRLRRIGKLGKLGKLGRRGKS